MTLRVVELFSGIGAQRMALMQAGIDHEVVAISEINKHSLASYEAIYGDCPNLGDISKVEKLPSCDLVTYSFPCVDLSLAGKRAGMGEGTRSGLVWEVVRLLESCGERERPEWLLMENVPMVTSSELWPELLSRLSRMGYVNEYKDLDSSRFGSAQKRVRTFMLSRLGRFPPSLPTSTDAPPRCIRDIMEETVDERFIRRIPLERIKWREPIKGYRHPQSEGIDCPLLDASDPRLETRRIASEESLCPTLRTGVSVRVVSEEEEERAKALCEKADNVRLAPKGEKSIGTEAEGGTRLVVSPEEQRRKAGIDRDAELVEEHFRMAKGPGDRVRHEDSFEEGSSRAEGGLYSVQKEDGHVRFYRGNQAKAGLSEAQYYPADSQSPAVTSSHPPKVLDVDGGIGVLADIKKGGRMQNNRLHDPLGQSPALRTHGGGDHDIKVVQGIEPYDPDADIHVFGCRDDEGNIDQNADPTVAFRNRRIYLDDGKAPAITDLGRRGKEFLKVADSVEPSSTPVAGIEGETYYPAKMLYSKDNLAPTLATSHSLSRGVKVVDKIEPSSTPVASIEGETYYPKAMLYSSSSSSSSPTVTPGGRHGKNCCIKVIDGVEPSSTPVAENIDESFYSGRMLYSSSSSSPTVRTFHGRSCQIKVIDGIETTSGEDDACDPTDTRGDRTELVSRMEEGDVCPMLTPGRRVKRQNGQRYREPNSPAFTVTCQDHNGCAYPKDGDLIVRVLTPLECWRLMGFPDWAYEKASQVSSETQLYNQAGNSIVVEVLEAIFRTMVEPPKAEQSMLTRWLRWMPPQS